MCVGIGLVSPSVTFSSKLRGYEQKRHIKCEKHKDDKACVACAEACRACAKKCRDAAKAE